MQGLGALHESALVEHVDYVKRKVSRHIHSDSKSWGTDVRADSFRACLEDRKGCSHVVFKDSQVSWCGVE